MNLNMTKFFMIIFNNQQIIFIKKNTYIIHILQ